MTLGLNAFSFLIFGIIFASSISSFATPQATAFRLQDFLNRSWRNECVDFPLTKSQAEAANSGKVLSGPDGKPVPYQIIPNAAAGETNRIAFLANLDPFETRDYRFTNATEEAESDLKIEETEDGIRLSNGLTGISIRKKLLRNEAPIENIRQRSGKWAGETWLADVPELISYTAKITAKGPVFAEVECRAVFVDGGEWELRFRLQAFEPIVLVDESFSVRGAAKCVLSFGKNFSPDSLFFRTGNNGIVKGSRIVDCSPDYPPEFVFALVPWMHWADYLNGKWFGVYNEQGSDLVMLGARDSELWVDPYQRRDSTVVVSRNLKSNDIFVTMPLVKGKRHWMLGTFGKEECLEILNGQKEPRLGTLPQQYVIKHEFPLNRVKDYVLRWPETEEHPRLLLNTATVKKIRGNFHTNPELLAYYLANPFSSFSAKMDPVSYYLQTGDEKLGKYLAEASINLMQEQVDIFLKQEAVHSFGAKPHHTVDSVVAALNLGDAILSGNALTPEQRNRIRSQAAFLGYVFDRVDYWSPSRGFAMLPNMTTLATLQKIATSCFIASHPMARTWCESGLQEMRKELKGWSDARGGWLEAPHYAMVSHDAILGAFLMAHNSGFGDDIFNPLLKNFGQWFAKISTPPDARINNWRHLPPIGNTNVSESSGEFGLLARIWKERDPQFSSEMQWMFQQQGAQTDPGVGGQFPAFLGYRNLLLDRTAEGKAPVYGSEWFPKTGLVLRNKFPSDRETMLYMPAGIHRSHYDNDSGSITIWGRGRIIADDFGYYGFAPVEDHNMVDSTAATRAMHVDQFAPSENFDYVHGVSGGWTRQIALVKNSGSESVDYFVICDTLPAGVHGIWRLWLTCNKIAITLQAALVDGKEDVDTDIFFALPEGVKLETEEKNRTSVSGYLLSETSDKTTTGPTKTTQTGLIASKPGANVFNVLIYPRLKGEKRPMVTSIADGRGVKIAGDSHSDYVFLSNEPFSYREGDIVFEGKVGAIQTNGKKTILSLGDKGRISIRGHVLTASGPATKALE